MEDKRFDALTRSLAQGTSRRRMLKGLFGGLVGGAAVSVVGAQRASAADRALGESCTTEDTCISPNICTVVACVSGTCEITEGGCPDGELCCPEQGGSCAPCCEGGPSNCPTGAPVCLLATDPTNNTCVECATPADCPAVPDICTEATCIGNICGINGGCLLGETCCDVDGVGIDCVNLLAPDDQYCGTCGVVCDACSTCTGGICVSVCDACSTCSAGICVDTGACCQDRDEGCFRNEVNITAGFDHDCCSGLVCCDVEYEGG